MTELIEATSDERQPNGVEQLKAASDFLRGSLAEEFADPNVFISDAAYQLLKFHGSYQQDDRDLRNERRRAGESFAFSFMVRLRLPGGDLHPELYLALDRLSEEIGNGTVRLTTRQSVQLHGIGKRDLRTVIRAINAHLSSTLGACGDVNRNVMASSAPFATTPYELVRDAARRISTHLLPRTSAYAELWLDADEAGGGQELARIGPGAGQDHEPLYGPTYLPRKFKTAVAVAGDNSVDLFTNDLGVVPIFEDDRHVGWNIYVGGGLGRTHRKPETFPRLADPLGFIAVDDLLAVSEAVVTVQRDHGDRTNRRHARLKYLIAERGIDWFRERVKEVSGLTIELPRPVEWARGDDLMGWHEQGDGRWFLGLRVLNGRLADHDDGPRWRSALRAIALELQLPMRITPNQNLYLVGVGAAERFRVDAILAQHGVADGANVRGLRRLAMACPALPTCGLAVTEAERALPGVLDSLQAAFDAAGLDDTATTLRMTGCPNGCARPYVAEIGLVGDAVDRYQVWLGGDAAGTRMARQVADRVHRDQLPALLEPVLRRYHDERIEGEALGDFIDRTRPELGAVEAVRRPVREAAEALA
jgi:sulfite reductase (ferredoxin)